MNGIEKSFLKSWAGWDEIDVGDLQFNDVELNDETRGSLLCTLSEEVVDSICFVAILSQSSKVEFYNEHGDVIYSRDIKLVFVP